MKELKLATRKILSTSGLEKSFWPVAAKAAASMQRTRVLKQVPSMLTSFGSKVLVKKRRYAASGALIRWSLTSVGPRVSTWVFLIKLLEDTWCSMSMASSPTLGACGTRPG